MAKHAVIRTDKMAGTTSEVHLYSVMYQESDSPAVIDNGHVVQITGVNKDNREVFDATAPQVDAKVEDLAFTAGVVLFYDESTRHYEDEWENEAGRPVRAYGYHVGDMFGVTAEAFNGTPEANKFVDFEATKTTLKVSEAASATTIGKIVAVETIGRYTYYVIRVISPVATPGVGG